MSHVKTWSTTAANNNGAPPNGWPEGMTRPNVNDCAREMMAAIATLYQDGLEMLDLVYDKTVSKNTDSQLKVASGDVTGYFPAKRRIYISGGATSHWGYVTSSSYVGGSDWTLVDVSLDGGVVVPAGTNAVTLHIATALGYAAWRDVGLASGKLVDYDDFGDAAWEDTGPGNGFDADTVDGLEADEIPGIRPNLLDNPDFEVAQRGTSFTSGGTYPNNDAVYLLDRWALLSDGNDVVDVSQDATERPTGAYCSIKLDVETADKKFGILQILEARNARQLAGGTCSLSFQAKRSGTTISALRAAVLVWTGTEDSPLLDVVSAWPSEGANPTLATSWAFANTPADLADLTTNWQTFTIENISVSSAAKNVAVFIWVDDDTHSAGDFVYISRVKLEPGAAATAFQPRTFDDEMARCQRTFAKTFPYGTAPVQNGGYAGAVVGSSGETGGRFTIDWRFKRTLRTTPTVTTFNPTAADALADCFLGGGADQSVSAQSTGDDGVGWYGTGSSNCLYGIHGTADAEIGA